MLGQKREIAFTLAEVLITLAIIGVVAAMTVPIIMQNFQDAQYKTAYKKAFSVAQQSITSANQQDLIDVQDGSAAIFNSNFLAYMNQFKVIKVCTFNNGDKCWSSTSEKFYDIYPVASAYSFIDASGFSWSQYSDWANITLVDTNGLKKPNRWGKDMFAFCIIDPVYYNKSTIFDINDPNLKKGTPTTVIPIPDNYWLPCTTPSKCATEGNYWGTKWLNE